MGAGASASSSELNFAQNVPPHLRGQLMADMAQLQITSDNSSDLNSIQRIEELVLKYETMNTANTALSIPVTPTPETSSKPKASSSSSSTSTTPSVDQIPAFNPTTAKTLTHPKQNPNTVSPKEPKRLVNDDSNVKLDNGKQKKIDKGSLRIDDDNDDYMKNHEDLRKNRSLSMNYTEEAKEVASNPSPLSRSNFRKRRLTYARKNGRIAKGDIEAQKQLFASGEIGSDPIMKPPFPQDLVGTYSCHGIEPAYDENDRSDIVVAKINQDRGCVAYPYGNDRRQALFAVYDGHGEVGDLVSQFVMNEIQLRLEVHPKFDDDIEKAFCDTFVEVDEALKGQKHIDPMYSGTTAVAVVMRDTTLYIANAGDSRAVMAKRSPTGEIVAENLSIDQNPNKPDEQARIESMGGFVSPPPEEGLSARVWLDANFTQIGLAMGRSIGDHAVKPVGVIALPVVSQYELSDVDEFLICASDGVWEFIDSSEAVDIVLRYIKDGSHKACEALIETAAQRWREFEGDYRDDITAVIVQVQQLWDLNLIMEGEEDGEDEKMGEEGEELGDKELVMENGEEMDLKVD